MDLGGQLERQIMICQVDADGDLNRYLQECMMVHDEWVIHMTNLGGTAEVIISFCPISLTGSVDKSFFCALALSHAPREISGHACLHAVD